ncbi:MULTISPECIES: Trm112 family protein [Kitasatospora]|uniref:Trm112 family protein n=1 Tax=Kitasatospora cystarginea TaxID=58350 RepID=A0ABP5RMX1_9ACTN
MSLEPDLLDVLGCPEHPDAGLRNDPAAATLTCGECGHAYPVVDGVPILLAPAARG